MIYLAAHTQQASRSVQALKILNLYAIMAIFKGDALAAHTAGGSVQALRINNYPALWASLKAQRAVSVFLFYSRFEFLFFVFDSGIVY